MIVITLLLANKSLFANNGNVHFQIIPPHLHEISLNVFHDAPNLLALLDDTDPEVSIEPSSAILPVERDIIYRAGWLVWLIIGLYLALLIAVGYFYMRRIKSADDYLLGGGKMKAGTVGLSLFITLFSTITFLSAPGEMIRNGPLYLGDYLSYPFVYFIVGWLMIPFIMRLKVKSAYEILGKRFDNSIRTLSSIMFLSLRLLWMALIIYATADVILIPLTGLNPSMTPLLCAVIGIITLIYTTMGGIRAVVTTDVIQSFILLGGALLMIITITINLGGIGEWWPKEWMEHWKPPRLGLQTSGERTLSWFFINSLVWFICTNGSDQMSIQRFLSMQNPKKARQVLASSLLTGVIAAVILSILGLTLLAFFRNNPHVLKDGQSLYNNADQLLPQYIITFLPDWVTGLFISGLMAAAMSSLSSGVNSSSAVITEDFIKRFRKKNMTPASYLRTIKLVTVSVGTLVVALSSFIYIVPGNLYEVGARVSNLLVSPLFIMFFMAMFIPWATVFGTWVATISSITIAVLIAYWELFFGTTGPSFLLIMPGSLIVGVICGMIFSLMPIGSKANRTWNNMK